MGRIILKQGTNHLKKKTVNFFLYISILYINDICLIRKVETIIQIWKQRNLSWKGRIVIIKSLILSQFTHLFSMLYTPPYVLDKLKKFILNFLWNNKPPRVKYETMIANIKDGGLKLPDITSFHNAQKAVWIKRLQTGRGKWKNLFLILSNLNSLLLDHKLQVSDISSYKIGSFHHQVLNCWYDIKSTQPLTMIELYNECFYEQIYSSEQCSFNS